MQPIETRAKKQRMSVWFFLAVFFIVLSTLRSNSIFLAPAMLLLGVGFYVSYGKQPLRAVGLVVCIALALAAVAYKLGTDAGTRDRSLNSAQTAEPWSNNSFKPRPLRGSA